MSALPIFPGSPPPSIVGADELNYCVRYGNRWILIAINTDFCPFFQTNRETDRRPFPIHLSELKFWHYLSSQAVSRQVLSAQMSLTTVFGMGTGGSSLQSTPDIW